MKRFLGRLLLISLFIFATSLICSDVEETRGLGVMFMFAFSFLLFLLPATWQDKREN